MSILRSASDCLGRLVINIKSCAMKNFGNAAGISKVADDMTKGKIQVPNGKREADVYELSAEELFRRRYSLCRELMEERDRFRNLSEMEKDAIAQRLSQSQYLDLTSDWAFKHLFYNHKDLLIMLLNDILEEKIVDVEFRNSELTKMFERDKSVVFDLRCHTDSGEEMIVEMQKTYRKDQRDRLFYYGASMIRSQLESGVRNFRLNPVKIICIMNYEEPHSLVCDDKIIFQYRPMEVETGEPYGEQLSIYFFELPRVMRLTGNFESPVAGWCGIFRNITNFVELRKGNYGQFQRVVEAMAVRSLSEVDIREYFNDMMTLEDMEPYIEGGHELGYRKGLSEGLKKGLEQGREEGRMTLARALVKAGFPVDAIVSAAGLSPSEIARLTKEA